MKGTDDSAFISAGQIMWSLVSGDPVLEVRPRLCGKEDIPAYRAPIVRPLRGTKPLGNAPRAYHVVAGETDLPFDDASFWTERAAFREADDAAFAAVGLYAVFDPE